MEVVTGRAKMLDPFLLDNILQNGVLYDTMPVTGFHTQSKRRSESRRGDTRLPSGKGPPLLYLARVL